MNDKNEASHSVGQSDQAPVVVGLPNGQKIVLGPQKSGTTIEIASWTGAGAPDSRTERIVIAFGSAASTSRIDGPFRRLFGRRRRVEQTDDERIASGEEASPEAVPDVVTAEMTEHQKSVNGSGRHRWRIRALTTTLVVLVVVGFVASPLRLIRPDGGLDTTLGATSDSLMFVKPVTTLSPGMSVVVVRPESGERIVARVSAREGGAVLLATDDGFLQASASSVLGEIVVVVPLLGILAFWK